MSQTFSHSEAAERITLINALQATASESVAAVFDALQPGMSELEVAGAVKAEFSKRGVTNYWYDIPIIVLIGTQRFLDAANADYSTKAPSKAALLHDGSTIYIDVHPQDTQSTLWGDWNTMAVFRPRPSIDDEQVAFLEEMRTIHREGISNLTPAMTGAGIMQWYLSAYKEKGITPILGEKPDMGHTIHEGLKLSAQRLLINAENDIPIGGKFYAVEPAGSRPNASGDGLVVARFEECVYIPNAGESMLLGSRDLLPVII